MDSQQFYNPNAVKPAPRYFSSQFRPFNHEPKPVSKLGKKISLGAKITQATGGSGAHAREEPRMKMAASPAEDTHLHDTVRVETPEFPPTPTDPHREEDDHSRNHSAVVNASDEDSDDQDVLRSLFSDDLGSDSSDTESHLDFKPKGIRKPSTDRVVAETQRSGTGDSKDIPIVLEDESCVDSVPEPEQEVHRGFDERIPLSLAAPQRCGDAGSAEEANSCTVKHSPLRKRKRGSESSNLDFGIGKVSPDEGGHNLYVCDPSRYQRTDEAQPLSPTGTFRRADHGLEEDQSDLVWEHGRLRGYKTVNGKPLVLVPWRPTWEPAAEFPTKEVDRVKRWCELRASKRPGRPSLKRVRDTQGRPTWGRKE